MHRWAKKKNIIRGVRPEAVFGDTKHVEYFCGKTYVVDRDFCKYIVDSGRKRAILFQRYMGGSEDLMVGSLYPEFRRQGREDEEGAY